MARTKEFDVDEAIDKALDLFWANGYEATSIQDLVEHLAVLGSDTDLSIKTIISV